MILFSSTRQIIFKHHISDAQEVTMIVLSQTISTAYLAADRQLRYQKARKKRFAFYDIEPP